MHEIFNLWDKVKRYFAFSPVELRRLVLAILILGFIAGFDDGRETLDIAHWLFNLLNTTLVVALAVIVRESVRRVYALRFGHKVEIKLWTFGLAFALMLVLITQGKAPLLVYGGMVAQILPQHRIGFFRYGLSYKDLGGVAFSACFSNLALAFFFRLLEFLPSPLIHKAVIVNILFACFNMLPIPPLDGSVIMFASRTAYIFTLILIVSASLLLLKSGILIALLGSIGVASLAAILYNIYWD